MGEIKKVLSKTILNDRELHNSRLFVDLSEQVHIHFRELRTVYSTKEFFEYANIIARSARYLKKYLLLHPLYKEQKIFDNVQVALGARQQTRPLRKSPKPNKSKYFNNRLQIELQGEKVIDEIHIHYRDYRMVMDQQAFRMFSEAMKNAVDTLDEFLTKNKYVRIEHPFRKEVAQDPNFESRHWKTIPHDQSWFRNKVKAVLYYVGGESLIKFIKQIFVK